MKKSLIAFIVVLLLMSGCSNTNKPKPSLTVLAPKGAPALSLLKYDELHGQDNLNLVDGSDILAAELTGSASNYDIIIAPINMAKFIENGNTDYQLAGIVTWGNLYLVQNDDLVDSNKPVVLFGEGAVPQVVLQRVIDFSKFDDRETIYLPSVADVQGRLLAKEASYGLLAEAALTATLIKAEEQGIKLSVTSNIQELWQQQTGTSNYPQAAVFVKPEVYKEKKAMMDEFFTALENVNDLADNSAELTKLLTGKEEFYGVTNSTIITKAWKGMNINYRDASEVVEEIKNFLSLFNISLNNDLFIR